MSDAPPAPSPAAPVEWAVYALLVFAWGTSWIGLRMQLGVVAPEVSLLWRLALAGAITFAWAALAGERLRPTRAEHGALAPLGALMFSVNFALFYHGGRAVPAGLLAVVFSLASVVNVALDALRGAPPPPRVALGGLLGALGVGLMFLPEVTGAAAGGGEALGLALCVLGTLLFCLGNQVMGRVRAGGFGAAPGAEDPLGPLAANAWGLAYGAGLMALVALARGEAFVVEPTARYLGSLAYLAVVSSVLAFWAYGRLLQRLGPARAGYSTVMFPVVALAISTAVEGYQWTAPAALGLALALGGNLLVLRRGAAGARGTS